MKSVNSLFFYFQMLGTCSYQPIYYSIRGTSSTNICRVGFNYDSVCVGLSWKKKVVSSERWCWLSHNNSLYVHFHASVISARLPRRLHTHPNFCLLFCTLSISKFSLDFLSRINIRILFFISIMWLNLVGRTHRFPCEAHVILWFNSPAMCI